MIKELIVLDKNEKYSHTILIDECISVSRDRQVNGFNTFVFTLIKDEDIHKDYRILFKDFDEDKWYEYIVDSIIQDDDKVTFNCESSFYSTLSNYVDFVKITGNTVVNGLTKIMNSCFPSSDWNVGISNISGSYYMQRSRKQLKEVIMAWIEAVGGELSERIEFYNGHIVRYVDILKHIGDDRGKTVYDDREIRNINIKIPSGYTYTSAFGYGASNGTDENGNAILQTFKDIEWKKANGDPCDKPLGQTWLELGDEYKNKFGIRVDGQMQHRVTVVNFQNVATTRNLIQKTYDFLMENIQDHTEYMIKSADLKALGYQTEDLRFGDTVHIVIGKFNNLKLKARVSRYQEDLKNPGNNSFELNNYKRTITSQIRQMQSSIADLDIKVDGISKSFNESVLEKWNREINADSAYLMYGDPINGLTAYNAESKEAATKATRLKGGSLQVSNTKENGEFVWTTVLTGDGLIADSIYTGILRGNFFDFDLDNGVVKMGMRNSDGIIDNPVLYLDSNGNLHLKSLAKVEEKVQEIELKPTIKINSSYGTQQVYSPSTNTYIPNWLNQPLTLTPEIYVMDVLQTLNPSRIAWTKKNGTLGANETVSDGILTIDSNVLSEDKTATYQVIYNYAQGKSVSAELSFSLVEDGTKGKDGKDGTNGKDGRDGIDAYACAINPSGTSFTSSDGITYLPERITLIPQFQNCSFNLWQYSTDGIEWHDITSGQYGFTINAEKTLTVSNKTSLLTDTQKCLNIRLLSSRLNVVSVITISRLKDGEQGPQGIPGVKGADGKQYYIWLKYADTPTSGMSDNPTGKAYIGLAYNKESNTESTNYSDYTWSLIKGADGKDGKDGVPGVKGEDGKQLYTWIKYATSSTGANMSDDPTNKTYIGLAYNKETPTESTNASDYTWSLIKGEKGEKGLSLRTFTTSYTGTTATINGWVGKASNWNVKENTSDTKVGDTVLLRVTNTSKGGYAYCIGSVKAINSATSLNIECTGIVDKGDNGADGKGLATITPQWYVSTSKATQTGGSWVETMPTWSVGKYLWKRFKIVYQNPTSTTYTNPECDSSWEAVNEIEIGGRNYILNSATLSASSLGSAAGSRGEYRAINVGQSYMDIPANTTVTISFDLEMTVNTANPSLTVYNSNSRGPKAILAKVLSFTVPVGTTIKERVHVTTEIFDQTNVNQTDNHIEFYTTYGTSNWFKISRMKLEIGNKATDWSPAPEDTEKALADAKTTANTAVDIANDLQNQLNVAMDVIVGTQTSTTGSWTGKAKFSELKDGQQIVYWLPYAGSGKATLNLTLSDGTTTGAKNCYYGGTTRLTTHYPAGSAIRMIYFKATKIGSSTYEGWWADANYDSGNTYDRTRYTQPIKCGTSAIVASNIIAGKNGVYQHLKSGASFDISYPILYAGSAIAASGTGTNNYLVIAFNVTTTQNVTLTAYKPVYIKGTLSGTLFTPISSAPLTQAIPTSEDGYHYMLLGTAYSANSMYLLPEHPIFMYYMGGFKSFEQIAAEAATNIDNLQVGGRNLLRNSRLIPMHSNNNASYPISLEKLSEGERQFYRVRRTNPDSNPNAMSLYNNISTDHITENLSDKKVLISFLARTSHATSMTLMNYMTVDGGDRKSFNAVLNDYALTTNWKRYWAVIEIGKYSTNVNIHFCPLLISIDPETTNDFYLDICEYKIEFANKPSDWTPAPEDMEADYNDKINAISNTYTNFEKKADAIESSVKTVTEYTANLGNDLDGIKSRTETIESKIAQTDENITFNFTETNKRIDGLQETITKVNTYFNFSADGLLIGNSESKYKSQVTNDAFNILYQDNIVGSFSTNGLLTKSLTLDTGGSITLPPLKLSSYANGWIITAS